MSVGPAQTLLTLIFMGAKSEAKAVEKNETYTEYTLSLLNSSTNSYFSWYMKSEDLCTDCSAECVS